MGIIGIILLRQMNPAGKELVLAHLDEQASHFARMI
jgi:hypothetical protein